MDADLKARIEGVQELIGVRFHNHRLLIQALTHVSYYRDVPDHSTPTYQRLEFLGDAMLGAIVAERVYRAHQAGEEGQLTELRSEITSNYALACVAKDVGLQHLVLVSRRCQLSLEQNPSNMDAVCACVLEALIGAVYLDQGLEQTQLMIERVIYTREHLLGKERGAQAIVELTHKVQGAFGKTPEMRVAESGRADLRFVATYFIGSFQVSSGWGKSRVAAKHAAAEEALATLTEWWDHVPGNREPGTRVSVVRDARRWPTQHMRRR